MATAQQPEQSGNEEVLWIWNQRRFAGSDEILGTLTLLIGVPAEQMECSLFKLSAKLTEEQRQFLQRDGFKLEAANPPPS